MLEADLVGRGIKDSCVLEVMAGIRRERFVPISQQSQAYDDGPLPIGLEQTISQPYIVALMTQELKLDKDCEVLEIGTGSGYQTAVLAKLAKKVYTIERFAELSKKAQAVLAELEIDNVQFHVGDGSCGWPGEKIFDRIIVTAAVPEIPEPLIEQLVEGGLMVLPVGGPTVQDLIVCERLAGSLSRKSLCAVRFVKIFGEYGFGQ